MESSIKGNVSLCHDPHTYNLIKYCAIIVMILIIVVIAMLGACHAEHKALGMHARNGIQKVANVGPALKAKLGSLASGLNANKNTFVVAASGGQSMGNIGGMGYGIGGANPTAMSTNIQLSDSLLTGSTTSVGSSNIASSTCCNNGGDMNTFYTNSAALNSTSGNSIGQNVNPNLDQARSELNFYHEMHGVDFLAGAGGMPNSYSSGMMGAN